MRLSASLYISWLLSNLALEKVLKYPDITWKYTVIIVISNAYKNYFYIEKKKKNIFINNFIWFVIDHTRLTVFLKELSSYCINYYLLHFYDSKIYLFRMKISLKQSFKLHLKLQVNIFLFKKIVFFFPACILFNKFIYVMSWEGH